MSWQYVLQQFLSVVLGPLSGWVIGYGFWRGRQHGFY